METLLFVFLHFSNLGLQYLQNNLRKSLRTYGKGQLNKCGKFNWNWKQQFSEFFNMPLFEIQTPILNVALNDDS